MRGTLLAVLLLAAPAAAQTSSASIVGRVTDPTGAVVPGVTVKVVNADTNASRQVVSNEVGDYTVPYLNPGRYTLDASIPGFRSYRRAEIVLEVDQVLRIDIRLDIGSTNETVTITETAPALNTDSGARGEVTTHEEISEIPLDGRNFS